MRESLTLTSTKPVMPNHRTRSTVLAATTLLLLSATASVKSVAQPAGTVVVANMSDNTVTIFDAASGSVFATLPTGTAPHEIAVSADGRTAVITNYGTRGTPGNSLTVVDLETLTVRSTIDTGIYQRPHGIAYMPGDSSVAVTSEVAGVVAIVNVLTGEVESDIPTTQRASHMLAASRDGSRVFTTNVVDGTVSVIDPVNRTLDKVLSVAPMVEGIAAAPDGTTLWVGSNQRKTVSVVNVESGVVVDSLVGFGFPYRMAVTPDGKTVVLSDPMGGEIRIVDSGSNVERHRISVPAEGIASGSEFTGSPSPEGIALSRDGRYAFVSLQGRNEVAIVDLTAGSITSYAKTGAWPDGIGYSPLVRAGRD